MRDQEWIQASDGVQLFIRRWEAENPRGNLILVHGIGEHSGRYEGLAQRLAAIGFSVWAMDHRGHGRSQGVRGDCQSMDQLLEDLDRLVRKVGTEHPGLARILIGHSLGGLVAMGYAASHADQLRGVALSSPALRLAKDPPKLKVALAQGMSRLVPQAALPNGVNPRFLSRDPEVVRAYETDPLVHRVITARCAVILQRAMRESFSLAERMTVPILILQGGSDQVCDPKAAQELSQRIPAAKVTFRRYDRLYHELFNEPEKDEVIRDLAAWLDEVT